MQTMGTVTKEQKKSIGEQLIDERIISRGQLAEALAVQKKEGGTVIAILLGFNHLTPSKVEEFLASRPGIPSIEIHNYTVPAEVISRIPRDFAVKHQVFPIDKMGKLFTVGMAFPWDSETIAQIEQMTSLRIKAFLCRSEDIRRAIDQYYPRVDTRAHQSIGAEGISVGARIENITLLVQKIDGLPGLPETVQKVQEASHRIDVSLKEIADIVAQDPVISARLLKLANSPAYGFKHMVDNVDLAVSLLGLKEISMAVLSSAVIDMTEQAGNFDCAAFSRISMFCANAARRIGALCGFKKNPGIFTAGLLCEIGRFALARSAPARYDKIPAGLDDTALCTIEEKLLGIGHPEAGFLLADHWELPPELIQPIRYHLAPEHATSFPKETAVIALAARLSDAHAQGLKDAKEILNNYEGILEQLGLSAESSMTIYTELGSDIAE